MKRKILTISAIALVSTGLYLTLDKAGSFAASNSKTTHKSAMSVSIYSGSVGEDYEDLFGKTDNAQNIKVGYGDQIGENGDKGWIGVYAKKGSYDDITLGVEMKKVLVKDLGGVDDLHLRLNGFVGYGWYSDKGEDVDFDFDPRPTAHIMGTDNEPTKWTKTGDTTALEIGGGVGLTYGISKDMRVGLSVEVETKSTETDMVGRGDTSGTMTYEGSLTSVGARLGIEKSF